MHTAPDTGAQQRFMAMVDENQKIIAKVCRVYSSPTAPFADLYQEVMANLWAGMQGFRNDAKVSTWIYRVAINTCISWHRRNGRNPLANSHELSTDMADAHDGSASDTDWLYALVNMLNAVDKAILTMWLDDADYDEIAQVMGMSKVNIGVRLHRIRLRLKELSEKHNYL